MRQTLIYLVLAASIGINIGLLVHVGGKWRSDHLRPDIEDQRPERFPTHVFLEGGCEAGTVQLDQDRLATHLQSFEEELDLSDEQSELIGALILQRGAIGCQVREQRKALQTALENRPLQNPETAKPFINDVLELRKQVISASLQEIELQTKLLESLSADQLRLINARTLPRLIPGLSFRELSGRDRRPSRP